MNGHPCRQSVCISSIQLSDQGEGQELEPRYAEHSLGKKHQHRPQAQHTDDMLTVNSQPWKEATSGDWDSQP